MLKQIHQTLLISLSKPHFRVVAQLIIFALILLAALIQQDPALAAPSWGNFGG